MRAMAGLGILVLLYGCGDEGYSWPLPAPPLNWGPASTPQFPAEEGGLAGAWFFCKQTSCAQLDDGGLLFKVDGTWRLINAPGSTYDPGESFCEESEGGSYSWNGTRLEMVNRTSSKTQTMVFTVTFAGELATLSAGGQIQTIMKRVTASSVGLCAEAQPIP